MAIFDKNTIIGFAENVDESVVNEDYSALIQILTNVMSDLSKKNAMINSDLEILPINEFSTGAITPISSLDVFLVLKSPQIELNTIKIVKNKFVSFWERLKLAWQKSKIKKKRKKRKKNMDEQSTLISQIKGKYNINDFCIDLVNAISKYITPLNLVSSTNAIVSIKGDDFTYPINIYPAIKKGETYSVYDKILNKFFSYDFSQRWTNLQEKFNGIENKAVNIIKIYNMLYFNINNKNAYQPFIESLVYNMPLTVFDGDDCYQWFIKSINFLNNTNLTTFISVLDNKKLMFKDENLFTNMYEIINFIKNIKINM